jgi:ribosomal protein S18 acetylase RimI-like enzyme
VHALPPGITLRPARPDDEAALFALRARAIRVSAASHYAEDELEAWARRTSPDRFRAAMLARVTFVAEAGGPAGPRIAGYAQLEPEEGVIEAIYVDPDFQRQGVGAALFAAVEREAGARGLPGLVLEATLNATAFYAAMGCRQEGVDHHELAPGVNIACVVMDKRLAVATEAAP